MLLEGLRRSDPSGPSVGKAGGDGGALADVTEPGPSATVAEETDRSSLRNRRARGLLVWREAGLLSEDVIRGDHREVTAMQAITQTSEDATGPARRERRG